MTIEESTFEDDISRSCLTLSSHMENCFRATYGRLGSRIIGPLDPDKFDNASNKVKELAIRTILALGLALSVVFAGVYIATSMAVLTAGSKIFKATGFYLQKENFIPIQGKAEETSLMPQFTVMVLDAADKKSYPEGLRPWEAREEAFIEEIKKANPTILVVLGVNDPIHKEKLIEQLKESYARFYTHIKEDTSGLFIATKTAVDSFDCDGTDTSSGLACIELKSSPDDTIPLLRIISGAHANAEQITQTLNKKILPLHTLFVGNTEEDLSHLLRHSFEEPTHSDELAKQYSPQAEGPGATQNLVSLVRYKKDLPVAENKLSCLTSKTIRAFDEAYNTQTAVTDNHAILVSLQFHV